MKWLFLCAHPDDREYFVGYLMAHIAHERRDKDEIIVYSMTRGEMSDYTWITKSTKLAALVRTKELTQSCKILGLPKPKFLGFFDGFVRVSEKAIDKISKLLREERPDVIVAPEPMFTYYYHTDHIRTGRIVFYAVQKLIREKIQQSIAEGSEERGQIKIPAVFYFGALINDFYFPKMKRYKRLIKSALRAHVSQQKLLIEVAPVNWITSFIHSRNTPGSWKAEALRYQYVPPPKDAHPTLNEKEGKVTTRYGVPHLHETLFKRKNRYKLGPIRRILYVLGYKMEEGREYSGLLEYVDGTLPADVKF